MSGSEAPCRLLVQAGGYLCQVTSPTQQLAPALDIDARLTEIERSVNLLLNVTPVNAAEAWADFERSDFGTAPTLRLRPLEFEPDLVRRDLYNLEIENVTDPALHTLFRAKRDEIARQITALEDRDTSRFVYGSLQLYGGIAQPLASAAEELLETIPAQAPSTRSVTAGAFAEAARAEFDRYRAVYPDFPAHIEVRDDISELMVSFGRLLIPEAAAFRADRVEPLLHHEVGTHVVTYQNGARQPLTLLTIGLPGYDETQEGLAVLAEYLTGGLDPRRLRVLAARVVAIGKMLDGAGFLEIFESLRAEHRIPTRTAWSIAIRVVVGGGSVKDAIYLRGITRILEALAEGISLDVLFVGKLALDHIPLIQDLLDREVLQATMGPSTLAGRARRSGAPRQAARGRVGHGPLRRRGVGMRLAFFVNDVATEVDEYTTTRLARAAAQRGHEVWYVGVGDVELGESDGQLVARAHAAEFEKGDTLEGFMERIKERDAERIVMDDLDALFLRNESIDDLQERPWASPLGVVFGQMLKARGVTVVNDPMSLVRATSKLYLEEFPEKIRPRSLVTRDPEAIERFVGEVGHSVVKPLYGAKGRNVFMIEDEGEANLAQMTEAVLQDGYAIVQEFVDGGEDGDARIFLLEGQILERDGTLAAFRRVPTGNDPRANISTGGRSVPLEIGDVERGIVEAMSEKLVADGMYFVGIDVIGDKVVEINAESPGGMQSVERLYEIDVCPTVIEALERRTGSKS